MELVFHHAPVLVIITCKTNGQLEEALFKLSNFRQQKENDNILLWILASGAAVIGVGRFQSQMTALVDNFNGVLAW
jgi:hypothetical protein